MRQPQEIKNVKYTTKKDTTTFIWENLQLFCLGLTIFGQIVVGAWFLLGQGAWFVANLIAVIRDFVLHRPPADKIKNIVLTAITAGLIVLNVFGGIF